MTDDVEELRYRRPTEADYGSIVRVLEDWWSGRRQDARLPRLWLRHFTGTSWLAERPAGLVGFLVAFHSPDHPEAAVCHLIGVHPSRRRRGIGRELYERCFADARAAGRSLVVTSVWPGNRIALDFHLALGFEVEDGPDRQNLYGTRAIPAYDEGREDRALLVRRL